MEKKLKRIKPYLYHYEDDPKVKISGFNSRLFGDSTALYGDCTGILGNCTGICWRIESVGGMPNKPIVKGGV